MAEHGRSVNNPYSNVAMKESRQNRTSVLATRGTSRSQSRPFGPISPGRPGALVPGRRQRPSAPGRRLLLPGLALPDSVPALGGNIHCPAERQPDCAHRLACTNGLLGRAAAQFLENEIAREHPPIGFAELVGDGQPEFTQSHRINARRESRHTAHGHPNTTGFTITSAPLRECPGTNKTPRTLSKERRGVS